MANGTLPQPSLEELTGAKHTFGQQLLDAIKQAEQYPSASALRDQYMQNPNLLPSSIESLVNRRVQSTRGTIQDILGRATGGIESDLAMAQLARQGTGTAADRERTRVLRQARGFAQGGATPADLSSLFGNQLNMADILEIYNEVSPRGPYTGSLQQLQLQNDPLFQLLGGKMGGGAVEQGVGFGGLEFDLGLSPEAGGSANMDWDTFWGEL